MRHVFTTVLLCAGCLPNLVNAQDVDRSKFPDYTEDYPVDYSLANHGSNSTVKTLGQSTKATAQLPDHYNSAELKFFPPIFNQSGGSCGSAASVGYMLTHEWNAFRNLDGSLPENQLPTHFTWLFTRGNSSKDDMLRTIGVPSVPVYGGRTYSTLFGPQVDNDNDFGWMQGYDKWYQAMHNRTIQTYKFPRNVGSKEGREDLKRWIFNHNGDTDFHGGGLAGIGVASGGKWMPIPSTPTNNEIGVNGKSYVMRWGWQVDHALTIVGYDDRIEFDINGNGIIGEKEADEVGAWIIVNSWGNRWENGGFIYCPYAYGGTHFKNDGENKFHFSGNFWRPVIHKVRKNYRPLRTIKIKMDYSRRSEIRLSAGISTNLDADYPTKSVVFEHFKFAGDGNGGKTNPAPEIPMLGRWADGKLHTEPMEFGYDLTDISTGYDRSTPIKYFFIVETRSWAQGNGHIYNASIIDYEHNPIGIETPFELNGSNVEIKNQGNKTIISTIVYGESYYAPYNLSINKNKLSWSKPLPSGHDVETYKIFCNDVEIANVKGDVTHYELPADYERGTYSLCAVYENNVESTKIYTQTPTENATVNQMVSLSHSGFVIPNVFSKFYKTATIEYWIRPKSLVNYNQDGGPGWGKFQLHASENGRAIGGWSVNERVETDPGTLEVGKWTHIAFVINNNALTVYVNGRSAHTYYSSGHNGIGGWGDFPFKATPVENSMDADIDEIRIWDYARSSSQVMNNHKVQYQGNLLPEGLIAYYKGNITEIDGNAYLHECVSGNHALIANKNFAQAEATDLKLNNPIGNPSATVKTVNFPIYTNLPVTLEASHSDVINKMTWTIPSANVERLSIPSPFITFKKAGIQKVYIEAESYDGNILKDSCEVTVLQSPEVNADFKMSDSIIAAGHRVCLSPVNTTFGFGYKWSMPGADVENVATVKANAIYSKKGRYTITLTVTAPDGTEKTCSKQVSVEEVAPMADFEIQPQIVIKGQSTFLKDKSKYAPKSWIWNIENGSCKYAVIGQNTSFIPTNPGQYNIRLDVKNGKGKDSFTQERALLVCNADSKNGLDFTHTTAQVTLKNSPFVDRQNAFTIEWWMNPRQLGPNCIQLGDSKETLLISADSKGAVEFFNQNKSNRSNEKYIIEGEWHHYAITFSRGRATFFRDGKSTKRVSIGRSSLNVLNKFVIGGTEGPINGQIDEFRIWNKSLSATEIMANANNPIENVEDAVVNNGLVLYYNFNQNGGDVIDATANHNDGVRSGFGPDGDAWGLSLGVFSLNFEPELKLEEVNSRYLKNFQAPFACDDQPIHTSTRFGHITDWTLENTVVNHDTISGVHVNKDKNSDFTFTSGWDGFANLKNHKAYQTVKLPAGSYEFAAVYDIYEGNCQDSYLVVAKGKGLPDTENINDAYAYTKMKDKTDSWMHNSVSFLLTEETEVSLGLVINTTNKGCCTLKYFRLSYQDVTILEADGANGFDVTVDNSGYNTLYLPYPTVIPEGVTAYVGKSIEGNKITLESITGKILPAKTGVVIVAAAGNYHFKPSISSDSVNSLLSGVLTESEADINKRYYTFDNSREPGFYLFNGTTLEANKAFYVSDSNDTNEAYLLNLVNVGIDNITVTEGAKKVYDLSGRRVSEPVKGLYISNGKKVLVK